MALYKLPETDGYEHADWVEISFCLPCDDRILAAARGAIWGLAYWMNWERDENKRARDVARCIRSWLEDSYEEC